MESTPSKARTTDAYRLFDVPGIGAYEITLWLWYRRHHLDGGGAFVSDDQTTRRLRWSRRQVQNVRKRLMNAGLLKQVLRGPRPPAYFPIAPTKEAHESAPQEVPKRRTGVHPFEKGVHKGVHHGVPASNNRVNRTTHHPTHPGATSSRTGKETWLTPYADAWKAKMGGNPNIGQLAKAMKPLESEHGSGKVLAHWDTYLANPDTPDRVKNPSHFGQKFGLYAPPPPEPEGGHMWADPAMVFRGDEVLADD